MAQMMQYASFGPVFLFVGSSQSFCSIPRRVLCILQPFKVTNVINM